MPRNIDYGYSVDRGVLTIDRSKWDAMVARLGKDAHANMVAMDPAVADAAKEYRERVQADTPVETGTLQGSIHDTQLAPSDYEVVTHVYYGPIVEGRPPGGPAKGKGAMFAQNLQYGREVLAQKVEQRIEELVHG